MFKLTAADSPRHPARSLQRLSWPLLLIAIVTVGFGPRAIPAAPPITPKEAEAKTAKDMKPYSQKIPGTRTSFASSARAPTAPRRCSSPSSRR